MIELINVDKQFSGVPVLRALSLTAEAGQLLCLSGPSGCGKTTLLRLIAGLETPDAGTIRIQGTVVSGNGVFVPPMFRNVGMVFQDFALWPHLCVERHLDFVLRTQRLSRNERRDRVARLLDLCRLEDKRRAYPGALSGGQQQRLTIARALATRPAILLLDEPFSNLDDELRARIGTEIMRLKRDDHVALIMATHDLEEPAVAPDRVFRLTDQAPTVPPANSP